MKKTNNKGFSLVELIIVIAIMAILIGVLAPQYTRYVERSRVSADMSLLDAVYSACTVAATDPELNGAPIGESGITITATEEGNTWGDGVLENLAVDDFTAVTDQLRSQVAIEADRNIVINADDNGNFTVSVGEGEDALRVPNTPAEGGE